MSGVDQCPLFGVEGCLVCRGLISVHCLELRGVWYVGVDQCPLFGVEGCLVCRGLISVHCLELRGVWYVGG